MDEIREHLELQFSASAANALPPQNVDAEEAILGGILLDPEAMERVADVLRPEAFYIFAHQEIFKACIALHTKKQPTDLIHVSNWIRDNGLMTKTGGDSKLAELVDRTVSAVNIDRHAMLVADKWRRRRLIQAGNEIVQLGYDTAQSLDDVLNEAEQKLFEISHARTDENTQDLSSTLVNCFTSIEMLSTGEKEPGIPSGYYDLDEMIGGFSRTDLIIVGGRPSMGKTAIALGIARHVANNDPVLIFSLEMSKEQLGNRLLSSESGIKSERMRSGKLEPDDWDSLSRALGTLSALPVVINDSTLLSPTQMASVARQVAIEKGGLGMILIDYVQLMGSGGEDNRVQELSKISRDLKTMAKELNVPVVALSQLSREVETRTNKRPMSKDLRESGALEQDADVILMLYRDEYYNPNTPDRGIAEVIITKHRNGPVGTVKLLFDAELTRFKNLAQRGERA